MDNRTLSLLISKHPDFEIAATYGGEIYRHKSGYLVDKTSLAYTFEWVLYGATVSSLTTSGTVCIWCSRLTKQVLHAKGYIERVSERRTEERR
jgi:hypothetical protein